MNAITPQGIAEPLVDRLARILWEDDQEQLRLSDAADRLPIRADGRWELRDPWDRVEYRDRARRVLGRLLP